MRAMQNESLRVELVAGGGPGLDGSPAVAGKLVAPFGMDVDRDGNLLIVELTGERVRKVDRQGILTTAAGTGETGSLGDGGHPASAQFNGMHSLAVHPVTGDVYLADTWN